MDDLVQLSPEVAAALADGRPVVALESTVFTHGLPQPLNVETALRMEAAVREGGAVPATVGILRGRIHVGLTVKQITDLSGRPPGQVRKCSRRDLPLVLAQGGDGGTTVAGTMVIAHRAGIELFATGGIGGVHRGHPFDVSADLTELGRTPVTVVCSGYKSILDLALTREVLETNGVPIIGYGTEEVPAFFTRRSGLRVDVCVKHASEAAAIVRAHRQIGLASGMLVTVPVPEAAALDGEAAEAAIEQAAREADAAAVGGANVTPWLLARVAELTEGGSLRANVALLENNGRVAGEIARALVEIS